MLQSTAAYDVQLLIPCKDQRKSVVVNGNKTVDFTVPAAAVTDGFGYTCRATAGGLVDESGSTAVAFTDIDDGTTNVTLPFTFRYYGVDYSTINIGTNGLASFTSDASSRSNLPIPDRVCRTRPSIPSGMTWSSTAQLR